MSVPTIYFPFQPQDGLYLMGLVPGRNYNTVVTTGPTARRQTRSLRPPLRQWNSVSVLCIDPTTRQPSEATFLAMRNFEASIKGQAIPFYIFDPVAVKFNYVIVLTVVGGVATNLPLVLPFIGGSFSLFGTTLTDFDQGGPDGEWRLLTYDVSAQPDGDFSVTLFGANPAYVRYAVHKTHDSDNWALDWDWADPPKVVSMDIEQDLG